MSCSKGLSLSSHLLHDHLVILLKICTFNDTYNGIDIVLACSITTSLYSCCPSFVVIGRESFGVFLIAVSHEDFAVILITLTDIVILLELLIRLIIVGTHILTIELAFDTKVVIGVSGKHTLSICRLYDTLGKSHRSRYAISAHLLHGILCILIDIRLS